MALTTDRMSVLRGRPPVRAGGRKGFKIAHCWSVRSLGYGFGFIPFLRSTPPFGTDSECRTGNAPGRRPWPPPTNNAASGPVPVLAPGYVPAPPVGGEGSYAVAAALLPPGISPRASVADPRGPLAAA